MAIGPPKGQQERRQYGHEFDLMWILRRCDCENDTSQDDDRKHQGDHEYEDRVVESGASGLESGSRIETSSQVYGDVRMDPNPDAVLQRQEHRQEPDQGGVDDGHGHRTDGDFDFLWRWLPSSQLPAEAQDQNRDHRRDRGLPASGRQIEHKTNNGPRPPVVHPQQPEPREQRSRARIQ